MAIPFIGVAVRVAVKLGFHVAERKKWLPNQAYSHFAMERLKENNIAEASRLNEIALEKNPASEKAQILHDLIEMRIDAKISALVKEFDQLNQQLISAQHNLVIYRKKQRALVSKQRAQKVFAVLPFILLCLLSLYFQVTIKPWVIVVAIACLALLIFQFFRYRHQYIERALHIQELRAAIESTKKEIALLNKSINKLSEKINKERSQKSC